MFLFLFISVFLRKCRCDVADQQQPHRDAEHAVCNVKRRPVIIDYRDPNEDKIAHASVVECPVVQIPRDPRRKQSKRYLHDPMINPAEQKYPHHDHQRNGGNTHKHYRLPVPDAPSRPFVDPPDNPEIPLDYGMFLVGLQPSENRPLAPKVRENT